MSGRQRCRHHRERSNQMAEPIWKSIMTIHLIRYCIKKFPDVTNRLRNRQHISSTDFLMKKLNRVFSHPLLFHIYHIINRLYTLQPAFITLSKIFNTDLFYLYACNVGVVRILSGVSTPSAVVTVYIITNLKIIILISCYLKAIISLKVSYSTTCWCE